MAQLENDVEQQRKQGETQSKAKHEKARSRERGGRITNIDDEKIDQMSRTIRSLNCQTHINVYARVENSPQYRRYAKIEGNWQEKFRFTTSSTQHSENMKEH